MKTTLEIPDMLFRKAKSQAAQEGKPLKDLFAEGLEMRLRIRGAEFTELEKPWMQAFGGLYSLHEENLNIDGVIQAEFGEIDKDQWA